MRRRLAALVWPFIFTCFASAVLLSLGVWQLHRLAWKNGLIAQIEARAKAPPSPLPSMAEWPNLSPEDYEYRHVAFDGRFENDKEALVFHPSGGPKREPGYLVLTPLRLPGGGYVIVDRGFVPDDRKDRSARAEGEIEGDVHVSGLMRQPEARNLFTPTDEPDLGRFFTRDPAKIAAHFGLRQAAPFSVDADDEPVPGGWPKGGATALAFPNNHLSYAFTWFGLALGLAGVFAAYAWRELKSLRE